MLYWNWFIANAPLMAAVLIGLLAAAEAVVLLTPTKSDDLLLARIEKPLKKIIAFLNKKKGGGVHNPEVVSDESKSPDSNA